MYDIVAKIKDNFYVRVLGDRSGYELQENCSHKYTKAVHGESTRQTYKRAVSVSGL